MYDQNALRRYLQAGGRPEDIGLSVDPQTGDMQEPAPQGNALAEMIRQAGAQGNDVLAAPQSYTSSGQSTPSVNGDFQVFAGEGSSQNRDLTQAVQQAAQQRQTQQGQAQGPSGGPMRVVGSGNGATVELSPEVAPANLQLDYSRPAVDVPGVGKVYYDKSGMGAYAVDGNGRPTAKVILGYDDAGTQARNKALLDQQHTKQEIAQSQATVEHTQEATRASKVNNPDFGNPGGPGGPTGEALLQTIDPGTAATIKSMLEGRMQPPGQFALRSPRVMQLINLANQVDPTFDGTTWGERYKTAQDFSPGGKSGQAVQSITQAIHHAGQFSQAIDDLNNSNVMPSIINPIVNAFEQKIMGDPRQGVFTTKANALASELRKVYAGSGGGTLQELDRWQSSFDPNAGQDQQRAYLKAGLELLNGAIESRKGAYERGMGPKADFGKLIDPSSQAILSQITGGGTQASMTPEQVSQIRSDARRAIQQGAPLEKVRERLRQQGLPDTGF